MDSPYARIKEIREASTEKEANHLLEDGFILVKVTQRYSSEPDKQSGGIVYVLGRNKHNNGQATPQENPQQQQPPATNQTASPKVDPRLLERLTWKEYNNGGGEWAFYMDRDETLLPELAGAREFIERLRTGEELTAGDYTYRIKDKFLKRFQARGTQQQ